MDTAIVADVEKKSTTRSARFQADAHDFVEKLARQLYEAGVLPDPNFSTALNMLIRYAIASGVNARTVLSTLLPDDPPTPPKKR